ncbi:MAG: FG-GAP repeat protein [Planctomycetes bacterium]|nr:FG-GAP repeat protein [Planctomycetota bacterium]
MLRCVLGRCGALVLLAGLAGLPGPTARCGAQAPAALFTTAGPARHAYLGAAACVLGDLDGDGRTEFAFGCPGDNRDFRDGRVLVYRADGALLRTWIGVPGTSFGAAVAAIGDVDGDGVPDCAIGAPLDGSFGFSRGGAVWVMSGATGTTLRYVGGGGIDARLGTSVAGIGDIDGDSWPDYAAGGVDASPAGVGRVVIWSGASGRVLATLLGEFPGEGFGYAVSRAGDVDGDGTQDIAVGAPFASRRAWQGGMVSVYSGATLTRITSKTGVTDFGHLGEVVAPLDADWDGDGVDDYVATSPSNDDGAGFEAGSLYVFNRYGNVVARFDGAPGERLGVAVGTGGDVDADARPDIAVATASGSLRVHSGAPGHHLLDVLPGFEPGDQFGAAIDLHGDFNRDGFADLVVGAPRWGADDAGRGVVLDLGWRVATELLRQRGAAAGVNFGRSVAWVGDLDGDGASELAIAVPGQGRVVVVGRSGAVRLTLPAASGPLSSPSIAAAGDVNGDGVPDIVVGSPDDGTGGQKAGMVRVFSGASGAVLWQFTGGSWDHLGFAVAGVGDVDDDGYDDFAAGAPEYADPGVPVPDNYVRVWSGRTGQVLYTFGYTSHTQFGRSVARAGDIDGDGIPDVSIGAPAASVRAIRGGVVRVYSGATGVLLAEKSGNTDFEELGLSVGTLDGDWDGDGLDDYIAGSYLNDDGAGYQAGSLFVFNIHGGVVRRFDGAPGDAFGLQVAGGGDVDGDGTMDVVGTSDARGYQRVFAGSPDHRLLREFPVVGYFPTVDLRGDLDGDGYADLAVGCQNVDQGTGLVVVYDLRGAGRPPRVLAGGRACPTAGGRLPHAGVHGLPRVGTAVDAQLRAALPNAAAVLFLGAPTVLPLDPFGAPGCTSYVVPGGASLAVPTDARGRAVVPSIGVPLAAELIGVRLDTSWAIPDAAANALGVVTSTRVALIIGG